MRCIYLDVSSNNCGWYYNKQHYGTIKQNKDIFLLRDKLVQLAKERKTDTFIIEAPLLDLSQQGFKNAKITRNVMMFIGGITALLKNETIRLDKEDKKLKVEFIEATAHQKYTIEIGTGELLPTMNLKRPKTRGTGYASYTASDQRKDLVKFVFANYHKLDEEALKKLLDHEADAYSLWFYHNQRKERYSLVKSPYKEILRYG